jgi:uncharacterized protein DUF6799
MKNVFLSMIAVALSFGAFAQDTTSNHATAPAEQQGQQQKHKDMYVFKDSKVWQVKSGNVTELTADATLPGGTVVKTNGEVVSKDGQTVTLKDGQYIDVDGKIGQTTSGK